METVAIINGLITVPEKDSYVFKRTPEIMDWFASMGYGFHDLHDAKEPYAAINMRRELYNDFRFTNCSNASAILSRGDALTDAWRLDITSLIEEYLANPHPTPEFW